jgi:hypothetical protein
MTPTELRHQLRAAGYCPIPLFGKEPPAYGKNNSKRGLSGWQQLQEVTSDQINMAAHLAGRAQYRLPLPDDAGARSRHSR